MIRSLYNCRSCEAQFVSREEQCLHYKDEWHRYNLKRRLISLPPISCDKFKIKQAESQVNQVDDADKYCSTCCKQFSSEKTFLQHTYSKKHVENLKHFNSLEPHQHKNEKLQELSNYDETKSWETMSDDSNNNINVYKLENYCFFCAKSLKYKTIYMLINHLYNSHSFFIPYSELVINIDGLLKYLGYLINVEHICIWCRKQFSSLDSTKKHMLDKGHCKLRFDSEYVDVTLLSFYVKPRLYKKLLENQDKLTEYLNTFFGTICSIPSENNDFNDIKTSYGEEMFELRLPNGTVLGHRSLKLYYKQNMHHLQKRIHYPAITNISNGSNTNNKIAVKTKKLYASHHLNHMLQHQKGLSRRTMKRDKQNFLLPIHKFNKLSLCIGMQTNNQKHFRQQVDF